MAQNINEIEKRIKDNKSEALKEKSKENSRKVVINGHLKNLTRKEYSNVIKIAARECGLTPELEGDLCLKLDQGELSTKDLFLMLLESQKDDDNWMRMRKRVMKHVENRVHEAVTILMMASQALEWPLSRFHTKVSGGDHEKTYTVTSSLKVGEIKYISNPHTASSKKTAMQLSAFCLLGKILGIETKIKNTEIVSKNTQTQQLPTENYKGQLLIKCQQSKWPAPVFEVVSRSGEEHQPEFVVTVKLIANGNTCISATGKGANKKVAEQLASACLLNKLHN